MPIGNTKLIDYGIQNEKSDYRAHVCVTAKKVYIFRTSEGVFVIENNTFRKVPVKTKGIITATGYLVPPHLIKKIEERSIPDPWLEKICFLKEAPTTEKGIKAVIIVQGLLKKGMFPFEMEGIEIKDHEMQVMGVDIVVNFSAKIQVKCDYEGGNGNGGTGNLFLQTSECNPFKEY